MRKIIGISIATILIVTSLFAQEKIKVKDGKTKVVTSSKSMIEMTQPYKAVYSSKFNIGKEKYANMVLQLWKDYDNNSFTHDYFSDTASFIFSDGQILKGKQQIFEATSKFRTTFNTVSSTLDAWVPLHTIDTNADVVAIWGTETRTTSDGSIQKVDVHEVWSFNKEGKIEWVKQWLGKSPSMN